MQIAQRPLEFLRPLLTELEKCAGESDEIVVRKWLFQKMDRAQAGRLRALGFEMDCGQDNGARVRMACAQIVKEFLAEIVGGVDIEDEKVRPEVNDQLLSLLQAPRDGHLGGRRGLTQSRLDGESQLFVGREDEDLAPGRVRRRGMGRWRFVHNSTDAGISFPVSSAIRIVL